MGISVDVETKLNEEEKELEVNLTGGEMGILIGSGDRPWIPYSTW